MIEANDDIALVTERQLRDVEQRLSIVAVIVLVLFFFWLRQKKS